MAVWCYIPSRCNWLKYIGTVTNIVANLLHGFLFFIGSSIWGSIKIFCSIRKCLWCEGFCLSWILLVEQIWLWPNHSWICIALNDEKLACRRHLREFTISKTSADVWKRFEIQLWFHYFHNVRHCIVCSNTIICSCALCSRLKVSLKRMPYPSEVSIRNL